KNNPIPSTDSRWGSFNILAKQIEEKIKVILEDLTKQPDSTLSFNQLMVRNFYYSAIDSNATDFFGYQALNSVFGQIDGFGNMLELHNLLAHLKSYGVDALFHFNVTTDAKASLMNAVYISQGGLNLPDVDYYTNDDAKNVQVRKDYVEHIQN